MLLLLIVIIMMIIKIGKKSVTEVIEESLSSLGKHVPQEIQLISSITEFLKKHDDDDTHLADIDEDSLFDNSNNYDNINNDSNIDYKIPDDIDIEEKLEDIESLRMFIENYR